MDAPWKRKFYPKDASRSERLEPMPMPMSMPHVAAIGAHGTPLVPAFHASVFTDETGIARSLLGAAFR